MKHYRFDTSKGSFLGGPTDISLFAGIFGGKIIFAG